MKNLSIKTVVAIGIGAALFFLIGRYISIPLGLPNTYVQLQFAVLALFAVIYGPTAGFLIGFLGNTLIDLSYGQPWWAWILASAVFGLVIGSVGQKLRIEEGNFAGKDIVTFNVAQVIGAIIAWGLIAPTGDWLLFSEPIAKVFAQGGLAITANVITVGVAGTALLAAYAKTRVAKGSLSKD